MCKIACTYFEDTKNMCKVRIMCAQTRWYYVLEGSVLCFPYENQKKKKNILQVADAVWLVTTDEFTLIFYFSELLVQIRTYVPINIYV